ncbi:endonuclease domain-containing protein [Candidatus Parcubacteria bacterium]|nr:endonuclease domain-containing protein [Candidatus Parcubacteria bacterium]
MTKKVKIRIAREFRKKPTRSERMMWDKLRRNNFLGLGFRRQHVIEGFIVDFYCHKLKLVLEIDGPIHQYQIDDDCERQKIIKNKGIKIFIIKSDDVEYDIESVLKELKYFIDNNFPPPPTPPPQQAAGEGSYTME